jgi:MscS family membrane protein
MVTEQLLGIRRAGWIRRTWPGFLALLSLALGGARYATAQTAPAEPEPAGVGAQAEPSGNDPERDAPRDAVQGFLDACRANDFESAARYLDLGSTDADGATLARHLNVVLDQTLWVDLTTLSTEPEGGLDDGFPPDLEKLGSIETSRGEVDILLTRRDPGDDGPAWRFSRTTVDRIPALYGEFGFGILGKWLPEPLFKIRVLETRLWQWIGLLILIVLAYLVSWIVTAVLVRVVRALVTRTDTAVDDLLLSVTVKPFRLVLATAVFFFGARILRLAVPVQNFLDGLVRVAIIVATTWLALRVVDGFQARLRKRLEQQDKRGAVAVIPLGVKTAKTILVLLAGIALLQHLGFNVTGVIAGLGVGGIALALAAQKTIENLFGGATLVADQPVRVGDFCRFGDKVGTVEDIGLRSTRVRTLDRTVVSIPNSEFSQAQLENFAKRDRIRLFCMLGLRYETGPDQLRHVLAGLRRLLLAHPKVLPDPARVRFVGFGAYSLDLEVFAYIATPDWNEFLQIREDIFLRMMDVVKESGTGFAFPSQTTYLSRDHGLDAERTRKAEGEVDAWRQDSRLPFPRFDEATIAELDDTLDYPPRGSAVVGT